MNPPATPARSLTQGTAARFRETSWTLVLAAAKTRSPAADAALDRLCRAYWYPLYAFVRHKGFSPHDAQDITQAFLLRVVAKGVLGHVDRAKGRFRSFLLACLTNFLHNWRDAARPDQERLVWWDALAPEERYRTEPADKTPEAIFDGAWAVSLVNQVMDQLRAAYVSKGKAALFDALHPFLTGEVPDGAPARLATELDRNINTVKSDLSRLRSEFARLVRQEIRDTLADPTEPEIKAELRHLFSVMAK